jgi:hypothetical protein
MLISTALLLDSNIRNSVCTPAKLPCLRVMEGNKNDGYCGVAADRRRDLGWNPSTKFPRLSNIFFFFIEKVAK